VRPQQQPSLSSESAAVVVSQSSGGSFEAMTSFLTEQQDKLVSLLREERETAERQRQEMEAKLEEQRRETDRQRLESEAKAERGRAEMQARLDAQRDGRLRDEQLVTLQARLEALHAAKLLGDAELYAVEDIVADGGDQVAALLELSGRMVGDGAFSRQLRRKYA
jgi:Na+-translocating ferredoxin:NAD+ oxidoreductase RnfC subunit